MQGGLNLPLTSIFENIKLSFKNYPSPFSKFVVEIALGLWSEAIVLGNFQPCRYSCAFVLNVIMYPSSVNVERPCPSLCVEPHFLSNFGMMKGAQTNSNTSTEK